LLNKGLRDVDVVCEHTELCSQAQDCAENDRSKHRAESILVITDTIFAILAHVLCSHDLTLLALNESPLFLVNLTIETVRSCWDRGVQSTL